MIISRILGLDNATAFVLSSHLVMMSMMIKLLKLRRIECLDMAEEAAREEEDPGDFGTAWRSASSEMEMLREGDIWVTDILV